MDKKKEYLITSAKLAEVIKNFSQLPAAEELCCNSSLTLQQQAETCEQKDVSFYLSDVRKLQSTTTLECNFHLPEACRDLSWPEHSPISSQMKAVDSESANTLLTNFKFQSVELPAADSVHPQINVRRAMSELALQPNKGTPLNTQDMRDGIQKNIVTKNLFLLSEMIIERVELMVYREHLYIYQKAYWLPLSLKQFATKIRDVFYDQPEVVSYLSLANYRDLEFLLLTNSTIQKQDSDLIKDTDLINCLDGIIRISTHEILDHSPRYAFYSQVNVYANEIGRGNGEQFEKFLANCTNNDPKLRRLILEMIGVIVSGYSVKKIFHLLGPSNVGKSQLGKLCIGLVGDASNTTIRNLRDLTGRFGTAPLVGKKLCTCLDLSNTVIDSTMIGILKQLVGDDPIQAEEKYKNPFTFYNEATMLFAGNHPLCVSNMNAEEAFMKRIITIPFFNPLPQEEWIPNLSEKLLRESGYIMEQALEALEDLIEHNFAFTTIALPSSYQPAEALPCTLEEFLKTRCILRPDAESSSRELYDAYCEFCNEFHAVPTTFIDFTRSLSKMDMFQHTRDANGSGQRGLKGIALSGGISD